MEVHLSPDLERRLNDLSAQSGRPTDELLQDALAGYLNEVAATREMLDRRYDEVVSGRVAPIDGETAFAELRAKNATRRKA